MYIEINGSTLSSVSGLDEKFDIPEGIEVIGERCFKDCPNLKSIKVPEGVVEIESFAFSGCPNLRYYNLPSSLKYVCTSYINDCEYIDTVVLEVTQSRFFGGQERSVLKVSSDTSLAINGLAGNWHLRINHIRKIVITKHCYFELLSNEGITMGPYSGDYDPFSQIEVEEFAVEEGHPRLRSIDGILYDPDATILYRCPSAIKRTKIDMPDSVEIIGNHAFANCTNIEHINMSKSLKYINWAAFQNCVNLKEIFIPFGFIGVNNHYESNSWIASGCHSLKSIIIPSSQAILFNPGVSAKWYVNDSQIIIYTYALPSVSPEEPFMPYGADVEAILPISSYPNDGWLPDWYSLGMTDPRPNYNTILYRVEPNTATMSSEHHMAERGRYLDRQITLQLRLLKRSLSYYRYNNDKHCEVLNPEQDEQSAETKNFDHYSIMYRGEQKEGTNVYGSITPDEYRMLGGQLASPLREDKSKPRNPSKRKK